MENLRFLFFSGEQPFLRLPALNDSEQYHDNGNDEQKVYKSSHGVTAHQAQRPKDQQHYGDCI
jgi:hypothetical protein